MNVGGFITQIMGMILYSIAIPLMWILDFVQMLFRKLAGLDTTWVKADGVLQQQDGDILLSLITNKTVLQVLLAMTLVGVVLLIITTIIQMIRTEYTTEGSKNNKGTILGTALKAFAYFFIVPIACVFGIIVANYVLKALDVATSAAGSRTVAGSVFVAAASDANRVRKKGNSDVKEGWYFNILDGPNSAFTVQYDPVSNSFNKKVDQYYFAVNDTGNRATNAEEAAGKVDAAFSKGSLMMVLVQGGPTWIDADAVSDADLDGDFIPGAKTMRYFGYDNVITVVRYYNPADINYFMLYVGLALCIWTLFKAAFGMIKRMYKATMLFIISPGIIGIWPLDGGKAFQSWRTQFISSVLSAYGVVVALNLFFVVAGAVDKIYLFKPWDYSYNVGVGGVLTAILWLVMPPLVTLINNVMRGLFIIVGALMVSEMASTISQLIGAGDALKEGGEMASKVTSAVGKGAMVAMGGAAIAGKAIKGVGKAGKGIAGSIRNKADTNRLAELNKKGVGLTKAERAEKKALQQRTEAYKASHPGKAKGQSDNARIKELQKRQNDAANGIGKGLSDTEAAELNSLQAKKQSISKARSAQETALIGNFFKQSGMGKALNTMTGGMVPAFGGDAMAKASKSAQEAHPELKSDFAVRDKAVEDKQKNTKSGKQAEARATARDNYAAAKEESSRRETIVKQHDARAHQLLEQIVNAIKSGDMAKATSLQQEFNQNRDEARAMGITGTGMDKMMVGEMITKNSTSRAETISANMTKATEAENLKVNSINGKLDDDVLRGAFDGAAQSLQAAGNKLVQTAEQMAQKMSMGAAIDMGKPEAAIKAMGAKQSAENAQIINLLTQLVKNSKDTK